MGCGSSSGRVQARLAPGRKWLWESWPYLVLQSGSLGNLPDAHRSRCYVLRTLSAGGRPRTQSGSFQPLSQALHAGGIIHRDLKPNNVMLETDSAGPHVSIMDFGLARPQEAENTLFASCVIAGIPGYMAPEILREERPTKATDLFALGIVLHQVLTGERPAASGGLMVAPSPALRSARAPAELIRAAESFLSTNPESRIKRFQRVGGTTQTPRFSRHLLQKKSTLGTSWAQWSLCFYSYLPSKPQYPRARPSLTRPR